MWFIFSLCNYWHKFCCEFKEGNGTILMAAIENSRTDINWKNCSIIFWKWQNLKKRNLHSLRGLGRAVEFYFRERQLKIYCAKEWPWDPLSASLGGGEAPKKRSRPFGSWTILISKATDEESGPRKYMALASKREV